MYVTVALFLILLVQSSAFLNLNTHLASLTKSRMSMVTITDGVEFDTIAREWRLKWSPDNDKKSLAAAQQTLSIFSSSLKSIDGVKSVQRVVCGGCLDFKVITALSADKYAAWGKNFISYCYA